MFVPTYPEPAHPQYLHSVNPTILDDLAGGDLANPVHHRSQGLQFVKSRSDIRTFKAVCGAVCVSHMALFPVEKQLSEIEPRITFVTPAICNHLHDATVISEVWDT